ncbi:hypothetical protein AVEN_70287-1 [Araneus ventricosus]|uniref:Uncharacterized protein n=1 Tax=Araneus ventricosus TaxID=182803 RepID=A0A4Y2F447_ARAVE|nr:hypothetical protein AVEN_609-1 [Araneus ventricosus]GBM35881.1 hypothetical protein AVEN_101050-1 [Araneus ventricosus]GBM35900.1 hypothetical protein AVEN_249471-1 [Araneus ventricosus]GBM35952.1 hypothetical protein AVEN_70287-1 [Araneus ventricosus]
MILSRRFHEKSEERTQTAPFLCFFLQNFGMQCPEDGSADRSTEVKIEVRKRLPLYFLATTPEALIRFVLVVVIKRLVPDKTKSQLNLNLRIATNTKMHIQSTSAMKNSVYRRLLGIIFKFQQVLAAFLENVLVTRENSQICKKSITTWNE